MFQVGRFDPREEDRKKKLRKRSRDDKPKRKRTGEVSSDFDQRTTKQSSSARDNDSGAKTKSRKKVEKGNHAQGGKNEKMSTLRVIAPETQGPVSMQRSLTTKLSEEAFDDLDIVDDVVMRGAEDNSSEEDNDPTENQGDGPTNSEVDAMADPTGDMQLALRMSQQPIQDAARRLGLAPFLLKNLERDGYEHLFPIQALVIPDVIAAERHAHIQARDVCVAAPTGSGKTLAFVLPVLNALANRKIRRLRALVVLPSRDLAKQVFDVFRNYSEGSDLKIGLAIGQSDFLEEQKALTVGTVDGNASIGQASINSLRYHFDPGNIELALDAASREDEISHDKNMTYSHQVPTLPVGGVSAVDVLVCTPGRLVDHLDNTPGFTLQHLRFLVCDEADRLLSQSYHNWIDRVVDNAHAASVAAWHAIEKSNATDDHPFQIHESADHCSLLVDPITWRRGVASGSHQSQQISKLSSAFASTCRPVQLRKLLYSATLTKDPQKLAALRLVNPKHFDAHHLRTETSVNSEAFGSTGHVYRMPDSLEEFTVECTAEQKPIVLLAILLEQMERDTRREDATSPGKNIIVVFTASLEATHRLARLLQLLWGSAGFGDPALVAEFSSALNQKQRSELMRRCNDQSDPVSVVVCSDGMSRGMDIEYVGTVINYDVPGFAKTYVHRCGRTARAGKSGKAISLLKGGQVGQFAKMRRLIHYPNRVKSIGVKKSLVREAIPVYRSCVSNLRLVIEAEQNGEIRSNDVEEITPWISRASLQS